MKSDDQILRAAEAFPVGADEEVARQCLEVCAFQRHREILAGVRGGDRGLRQPAERPLGPLRCGFALSRPSAVSSRVATFDNLIS